MTNIDERTARTACGVKTIAGHLRIMGPCGPIQFGMRGSSETHRLISSPSTQAKGSMKIKLHAKGRLVDSLNVSRSLNPDAIFCRFVKFIDFVKLRVDTAVGLIDLPGLSVPASANRFLLI
jgi:hypothetical protein